MGGELGTAEGPAPEVSRLAAFDFIRYANVWEDADVLCAALEPVARGGRLLSVASSGDNVLALLTLDPREVVAADLSAAQLACLELRMAAFRRLDDVELLRFLGVAPGTDRLDTYGLLRPSLSRTSRGFWDANSAGVAGGVIHAGRFEAYFSIFRRWVLPLVHNRRAVRSLLEPRSRQEREAFYSNTWDGWRWRTVFRLFFSRLVMGRLGRDPAFFRQVEGSVATRILERSRYALTELPTHDNPYLTYILTGNYRPGALPRYLRPEWIGPIRERLDRIVPAFGPVERAGAGAFDGFNLSDIFEYMTPAEHEGCYAELIGRARPGARLVYWNLLAPRAAPPTLGDRVRALEPLAAELHARDLAWFYQALHVDEVSRTEPRP